MGGPFVVTTDYREYDRWTARAICLQSPQGDAGIVAQAAHAFRLLSAARFAARASIPMLLSSSSGRWHPDLAVAALLGLRRRLHVDVALMGCMWEPDRGPMGVVQRAMVRLADRVVMRYAVQSTEELWLFPETWGVARSKMRFVPFYATNTTAQAAPSAEPFVFAGGNSHREYEPLVAAARALPDIRFRFATALLDGRTDLPPNVLTGQVTPKEFDRLLLAAAVVVVPLRRGLRRAAGQQTYLNAMLAGIPVVVTDSPGVSDHLQNGVTGLVVGGSPEDYVRALRSLLAPENGPSVARMRRAAAVDVRARFTYERHLSDLLGVIDDVGAWAPVHAE